MTRHLWKIFLPYLIIGRRSTLCLVSLFKSTILTYPCHVHNQFGVFICSFQFNDGVVLNVTRMTGDVRLPVDVHAWGFGDDVGQEVGKGWQFRFGGIGFGDFKAGFQQFCYAKILEFRDEINFGAMRNKMEFPLYVMNSDNW